MAESKAAPKPKTRTRARTPEKSTLTVSDIDAPHFEDDQLLPSAFAAVITRQAERGEDVEFDIDEERMTKLVFDKPGKNLPSKRLFTVKAFNPNGVLVQLPFEDQIQNTAGSSREDAIGLRRYENKGFKLLFDFATLSTVYCAAWDCWAQAAEGQLFCSPAHQSATLPKPGGGDAGFGGFSDGATTSRVWG